MSANAIREALDIARMYVDPETVHARDDVLADLAKIDAALALLDMAETAYAVLRSVRDESPQTIYKDAVPGSTRVLVVPLPEEDAHVG